MLQCSPSRDRSVQARGNESKIRQLSFSIFKPKSQSQSRTEAPRVKFSTKVIETFQYASPVQCLDWSPASGPDQIAFGHQDGAVTIQPLPASSDVVKIPARQQRSCTSVKFRSCGGMLAIGLDKVRNDTSLTIYDCQAQKVSGSFANSECVSALTWIPNDSNTVLAALNYRSLRLYDIRVDPKENAIAVSIPTKAVYEITTDTLNPHSLASTYDNNVIVWDLRRFDSVALSLKASTGPRGSRVNQLRFRPDRRSHLAGLSDDGTIDLWRLGDTRSDSGQYRVSTHHHRTSGSKLVAFDFVDLPRPFSSSWNGIVLYGDTDRVGLRSIDTSPMDIGYTGMNDFVYLAHGRLSHNRSPVRGIVQDALGVTTVPQYDLVSANESDAEESGSDEDSASQLRALSHPSLSEGLAATNVRSSTASDQGVLPSESDEKYIYESTYFDISSTMYRRALFKYGMDPEFNKNLIVEDYQPLRTVWSWMSWSMKAALEKKLKTQDFDFALEGCLNIWKGIGGNPGTPQEPYSDEFFDAVELVNSRFPIDIFPESITQAPLRQLALSSIGWCLTEAEFVTFQNGLIDMGKHDKAAFHSIAQSRDIKRAIEVLELGGALDVESAVADFMAAKADDEAERSWRRACEERNIDLESPYVRAIFAYLDTADWRDVIDEQGLTLRERIAISIRYIRDEDLTSILQDLCRTEVAEGNLEGLLLTGINAESLDLLQTYVDRTGDVQTAALISSFRADLYDDQRVTRWVSDYRGLLDRWQMHLARCRFDLKRSTMRKHLNVPGESLTRQVCVRCHHCNALVASRNSTFDSRSHETKYKHENGHQSHTPSGRPTFCNSCRKPLPKCVVCLLPVNTDHVLHFCLTCNHSLHREHADEWFEGHMKCPASNCECRCRSRDTVVGKM